MTEAQLQREIVGLLRSAAKERQPRDFQGFFGGVVRNVVGQMPPEYFEEFVEPSPCGRAGCNCHEISAPFLASLAAIREEHNQVVAAARKAN